MTIRLNSVGGELIGFASWSLLRAGTATRVQYDVYSSYDLPAELTGADPAAAKRKLQQEMDRRFDSERATLKRLVESGKP